MCIRDRVYLDSSTRSLSQIKTVIGKLSILFYEGKDKSPKVLTVNCAKQNNSYDCGVYSIVFVEQALKIIKEKGDILTSLESFQEDLPSIPRIVTRKREEILNLIHETASKKKKGLA
eukprot:TRINITY_DN16336_c0_g1_i1.p1 TRINITY_DN16336_c0_g1~~TRINITY_DN16336_c0_g1_i1.p1  ORF type:complete len:136 (-),score=21.22 TRINITY_DN16336_c0_g1_i1:92-442(-)